MYGKIRSARYESMNSNINQSKANSIILCRKIVELLENDKTGLSKNMQGDIKDAYIKLINQEIEEWKTVINKIRQI